MSVLQFHPNAWGKVSVMHGIHIKKSWRTGLMQISTYLCVNQFHKNYKVLFSFFF